MCGFSKQAAPVEANCYIHRIAQSAKNTIAGLSQSIGFWNDIPNLSFLATAKTTLNRNHMKSDFVASAWSVEFDVVPREVPVWRAFAFWDFKWCRYRQWKCH